MIHWKYSGAPRRMTDLVSVPSTGDLRRSARPGARFPFLVRQEAHATAVRRPVQVERLPVRAAIDDGWLTPDRCALLDAEYVDTDVGRALAHCRDPRPIGRPGGEGERVPGAGYDTLSPVRASTVDDAPLVSIAAIRPEACTTRPWMMRTRTPKAERWLREPNSGVQRQTRGRTPPAVVAWSPTGGREAIPSSGTCPAGVPSPPPSHTAATATRPTARTSRAPIQRRDLPPGPPPGGASRSPFGRRPAIWSTIQGRTRRRVRPDAWPVGYDIARSRASRWP